MLYLSGANLEVIWILNFTDIAELLINFLQETRWKDFYDTRRGGGAFQFLWKAAFSPGIAPSLLLLKQPQLQTPASQPASPVAYQSETKGSELFTGAKLF